MEIQHKIIENHHSRTIHKFDKNEPYIPNIGDRIIFPEGWKFGEWFKVTGVDHYLIDSLIVIKVNEQ